MSLTKLLVDLLNCDSHTSIFRYVLASVKGQHDHLGQLLGGVVIGFKKGREASTYVELKLYCNRGAN